MNFLKITASLLLLSLLTSCVTQKTCLKKFPVQESHDTIVVYRDTTINVPVPGITNQQDQQYYYAHNGRVVPNPESTNKALVMKRGGRKSRRKLKKRKSKKSKK